MGFDDVLHNVTTMAPEDISLARIVYEANAMYTYVLHGYAIPPTFQGIRTVMDLCGEGQLLVDFGFFMFHKDLVARGVTMIRDNVGRLVFDDNLHAMLRRYEDDCNSFLIPNPVPAPELMAPFVIATTPPPEDSRTVFVSVPEGNPLTSQDILNYFESTMGLGFGRVLHRARRHGAAVRGAVGAARRRGVQQRGAEERGHDGGVRDVLQGRRRP